MLFRSELKSLIDETEQSWNNNDVNSSLLQWVDRSGKFGFSCHTFRCLKIFLDAVDDAALREANAMFRILITLHNRVTLLSDVYSSIAQTHGQSIYTLLKVVSSADVLDIVANLGSIHRKCLLENIALKSGLSSKEIGRAHV